MKKWTNHPVYAGMLIALLMAINLFIVYLFYTGQQKTTLTEQGLVTKPTVVAEPPTAPQTPKPSDTLKPELRQASVLLNAPLIKQKPELYNGCEVSALAMLLQYYGIPASKLQLAQEMKKDPTDIKYDQAGNIKYWGDPNTGFVGDVRGNQKGLGIYHKALYPLLASYIPDSLDLTGSNFSTLETYISEGRPVLVWTTVTFTAPKDSQWLAYDSPTGPVRTTFQEHAALLVGYDAEHVYVNDPLGGTKQQKLEKQTFLKSWVALGQQALAVSYTP